MRYRPLRSNSEDRRIRRPQTKPADRRKDKGDKCKGKGKGKGKGEGEGEGEGKGIEDAQHAVGVIQSVPS